MNEPRPSRFPEKTILRLSAGTLKRLHTAAERQETTVAEFVRRAIRSALDGAVGPVTANQGGGGRGSAKGRI